MKNPNLQKWLGTALFIIAATLLSLNFEWSKYGFLFFLTGHLIFCYTFYKAKDKAMFFQNAFFLILDGIGIYRWFL